MEVIDKGSVKPTHIMYQTNLSWTLLQAILGNLIKSGFIKEDRSGKTRRFQVTDKGRSALSYHLKAAEGLIKAEEIFIKTSIS